MIVRQGDWVGFCTDDGRLYCIASLRALELRYGSSKMVPVAPTETITPNLVTRLRLEDGTVILETGK